MPFWIHCFLFCVIILYQVHLVSSWLAISIHIFLVPSTSLYFKLLSIVSSFNLTQVVSEPTHVCIKYLILHSQWSCFSYLYTINCLCIQSFTTIPPFANADHFGLQLVFTISHPKRWTKSTTRKVWHYSLAEFVCAAEFLDSADWDSLLPHDDINTYRSAWKNYLMQIMEICVPHSVVKVKRNLPNWVN